MTNESRQNDATDQRALEATEDDTESAGGSGAAGCLLTFVALGLGLLLAAYVRELGWLWSSAAFLALFAWLARRNGHHRTVRGIWATSAVLVGLMLLLVAACFNRGSVGYMH